MNRISLSILKKIKEWSDRGDLNSRPPHPQCGALTRLRYGPSGIGEHPSGRGENDNLFQWATFSTMVVKSSG